MSRHPRIRSIAALAIPAAVIAMVAALHWSGEIPRPAVRAASTPAAPALSPLQNIQPAWRRNWPSGVPRRNLFLTRLDRFPHDVGTVQQPKRSPGNSGDPSAGAKSPPVSVDQNHGAAKSDPAAELSQIHLQSTMMHPSPRALVNGQIVGEGDFVGNFRVVRITLTQLVLEKQGVRFQITLK